MEENRVAHGAFTGAAADEHAPLPATPAAAASEDDYEFASAQEEDAYWIGVADGIRNVGGPVPPRLAARAAGQRLLVEIHDDQQILPGTGRGTAAEGGGGGGPPSISSPASEDRRASTGAPSVSADALPPPRSGEDPNDILHFTPAQLRLRRDGWTPQKQVEYVEALADTGVARAAAARVGMSEQGVNRLRRRAEARSFDRACDAALRIGGRRLVSIAYERAIEGSIKRHYYRGELKAEERVYNDRLLIALINKLPPDIFAPTPETEEVVANWEPWMEAVEQGLDAPPPPPPPPPPAPPQEPFEATVWVDDEDILLTDAPPPAGFELYEDGEFGKRGYQRELTPAELEYWERQGREAADKEESRGLVRYHVNRETFFPWGSEPYETSAPAAEPQEERSEASEACGESRPSAADGSAAPADEPDRRHGFAGTAQAAEPEGERSEASEPSGESRPSPDGGAAPAEPDRRHGFAGTAPTEEPLQP